jgi:inosine-uridine nucleoside N-ribohydrolase
MRRDPEAQAVFAITDVDPFPDDALALTYLAGRSEAELVGVGATYPEAYRRASVVRKMLDCLNHEDVLVSVGLPRPSHDTGEDFDDLGGLNRIGEGLIPQFPSTKDSLLRAASKYGDQLHIAAFAPLTDLAAAIEEDPKLMASVGGISMTAKARPEHGRLVPDENTHTTATDRVATEAVFGLQDCVPLTVVGWHAGSLIKLSRAELATLSASGNPAGAYIHDLAVTNRQNRIASYPERYPSHEADPATWSDRDRITDTCDVITAIATLRASSHPDMFQGQQVGRHTLIGMSKEEPGILPAHLDRFRADIMQTTLQALQAGSN